MIKIAIVEDDLNDRSRLAEFIQKYNKEKNSYSFDIKEYANPNEFLKEYSCNFDLIFLDIKMPGMNGMDLAKIIREKDKEVILFFITSLAQYAINGYEVEALDFVVKPIEYPEFVLKFSKAISRLNLGEDESILLTFNRDSIKIYLNDIEYIESFGHSIIYHVNGKEYKSTGSLKSVEAKINNKSFAKCNSGYLVNLKHVTSITDSYCVIGDNKLLISRPKKKEFKQAFLDYICGGES